MKVPKRGVGFIVAVILLLASYAGLQAHNYNEAREVVVYKGARCECCVGWIEHMRKAGFRVKAYDLSNAERLAKAKDLGVPDNVPACHTSVVNGYVIQGHVPAADIKRLLKERPKIVGIGAPGMPIGSPGMESATPEPYDVVAFVADSIWVYARH